MQAPAKRLPRGLSRATPQVVQMYWSFIEESVKSLWVVRDRVGMAAHTIFQSFIRFFTDILIEFNPS